METNDHIEVIEELINRNKNLEQKAHRVIKKDKKVSMYEDLNLKNSSKKKYFYGGNSAKTKFSKSNSKIYANTFNLSNFKYHQNAQENNSFFKNERNETPMKDLDAYKIEREMTKYAIHKMLKNIEENSKGIVRNKRNIESFDCFCSKLENDKIQNSRKANRRCKSSKKGNRRKKSPQQIYDDLNRQSWTIKIRKYKNPKLVPVALNPPQSEVDTLQHTEVQTPISMRYGGEKKEIINSKFDFYQTIVNSKLKRWAFNAWLSRWSRLEIKKLRNELRRAIDVTKDDIEEKKKFDRYPDNNSKYEVNPNASNKESEKDTPVNEDLYNTNLLKEKIFIDPKEYGKPNNESIEQIVDYYLGGE
ncbi:hypothetical protein M9Y10_028210 [Tritrichomonas musculus]|uniref:IQ calmodulin-binding motif family protein n=1 Tax=Tritrichomonas musculus TaxID=1915356 RepID=A0ABR2KIT5_9EUKA